MQAVSSRVRQNGIRHTRSSEISPEMDGSTLMLTPPAYDSLPKDPPSYMELFNPAFTGIESPSSTPNAPATTSGVAPAAQTPSSNQNELPPAYSPTVPQTSGSESNSTSAPTNQQIQPVVQRNNNPDNTAATAERNPLPQETNASTNVNSTTNAACNSNGTPTVTNSTSVPRNTSSSDVSISMHTSSSSAGASGLTPVDTTSPVVVSSNTQPQPPNPSNNQQTPATQSAESNR